MGRIDDFLLRYLTEAIQPFTANDIAGTFNISPNMVKRLVGNFVEQGKVTTTTDKWGEVYYRIKE